MTRTSGGIRHPLGRPIVNVAVVLVNQATDRVESLYRKLGYTIEYLHAPRRISCTGDRTPAREIIGTRNL